MTFCSRCEMLPCLIKVVDDVFTFQKRKRIDAIKLSTAFSHRQHKIRFVAVFQQSSITKSRRRENVNRREKVVHSICSDVSTALKPYHAVQHILSACLFCPIISLGNELGQICIMIIVHNRSQFTILMQFATC